MTTASKVPGGDDQLPGGNADESNKDNPADKDQAPPKGTVAYETYQKVLDEAKAAKKKVAEFEKAKRDAEETSLKEQGNYKKILEEREKELQETKDKLSGLDKKISDSRKMNAFLGAIGGDVPKQYWPLVDLEDVAVNPETGMPDESSVKRAAEKFEKDFPDVIKRPSKSKLPNEAPRGGGTKLSYEAWLKLPLKDQLERMNDVDKSTL
jgi:hypothetical protein